MSRWKLPSSWAWARAAEIADIVGGGTPPSKDPYNFDEVGYPWITPADLSGYPDSTIARGKRGLSEEGLIKSGATPVPPGTVLFTSRAPIGYCVVAEGWISTSQGFKNLVLQNGVEPHFVRNYLLASKAYAESLASGSTFKELSGSRMRNLEIPLAPPREQSRIVAKIDALQSKSRRARVALEAIPFLLEEFRRSVIAAAFRGELTADWREQNPQAEPASDLLKRIRGARRRQWEEAELAKMKARGKEPKDGQWKKKYQEPADIHEALRPTIPETWEWTNLGTIAELKGGLAKGKKRHRGARLTLVPYLRVANVQRGFLDLSEVLQIEATEDEIKNLHLERGDILFNEGGDRDKLGRGWVWESQLPECIHQNHVFRARLIEQSIPSHLISLYANFYGQSYFFDQGRQTTNLASISLAKLSSLPIPLLPSEEAKYLAAHLSDIDRILNLIQHKVELSLQQVAVFDRTILARAFRGELVTQDPNDESAKTWLKRIKKARAKSKLLPRVHKFQPKKAGKENRVPSPSFIPETHLRDTVQAHGSPMEPRVLWKRSDLAEDIDAFYAQLRQEISSGFLREVRQDLDRPFIELLR